MIEDDELRTLFQAESEERLKSLEEQMKKLETSVSDREAIEIAFRDAHTIKGSARMLHIQSIEKISHELENTLDSFRKGGLTLSSEGIGAIYQAIDAIQSLVSHETRGKSVNVDVASVLGNLKKTNRIVPQEPLLQPSSKLNGEGTEEKNKGAAFISSLPEQNIGVEKPADLQAPLVILQGESQPKEEKKEGREWEHPLSISTVRIDMEQVSHLMNQTVDLVAAKNRMVSVVDRLDDLLEEWEQHYHLYKYSYFAGLNDLTEEGADVSDHGDHPSGKHVFQGYKEMGNSLRKLRRDTYEDAGKLELITSSFTDQVQKLGLLPLSKLFDFFFAMINDLAQSVGKQVALTVEGGKIAVDKKIIEEMKDPLMHLLRNAISHGIESPIERKQKGKSPEGSIQLIGHQTSNHILIEVSDDGKGLDIEKIKEIAIQRKILSEKQAEALTLSEAYSLIFSPGFSTASKVSDLSGRGVGLDVVKNQVEKLNGRLSVESIPNQGCRFFIELPILHMTTQVILVKIDNRLYGLPIEAVKKCLFICPDQIVVVGQSQSIVVDNQPISMMFLQSFIESGKYALVRAEERKIPEACLILSGDGKEVALVVDVILEEIKVILIPPDPFLSMVKSIMGVTILKTGEVCLIFNPVYLIKDYFKGNS
ncbi:MAG: chemotaxis protein CheA [Parachlamydiaceae bacterium]